MPIGRLALIALACLAWSAGESWPQLATTHPQHMRSGVSPGPGGPSGQGLPEYRSVDPRSRVVMRRGRGLQDSGRPSRELSRACRNGRFRQLVAHRFVAVLDDKVYGAAIGRHGSLVDPEMMARDRIVYVFVGQGTTNCRVYSMGAFQGG